jgi:hypothetical protein
VNTDAYLWAIFALLFLALVLVVVTARRGPWSKPLKGAGITWTPTDSVRTLAPGVDPLWGKNRPEAQ